MEYHRVWSMQKLAKEAAYDIRMGGDSCVKILASMMNFYFEETSDDYTREIFEKVFSQLYYRKKNPRQIALKFSRQFASIKKLSEEDKRLLSGLCLLIAEKSN